MLHSEYTTSCVMAKTVVWHNFQSSSIRQAFHCFALKSNFIQPSVCKYVLFVCFFFVSARLQVSFIPLRFRYFGRRFSFRTVDLSRESWVMPPPLYDFRGKESKLFFADVADRENWNPRKIIAMFLRQNRENLATRKYPIIRYIIMSTEPARPPTFNQILS